MTQEGSVRMDQDFRWIDAGPRMVLHVKFYHSMPNDVIWIKTVFDQLSFIPDSPFPALLQSIPNKSAWLCNTWILCHHHYHYCSKTKSLADDVTCDTIMWLELFYSHQRQFNYIIKSGGWTDAMSFANKGWTFVIIIGHRISIGTNAVFSCLWRISEDDAFKRITFCLERNELFLNRIKHKQIYKPY